MDSTGELAGCPQAFEHASGLEDAISEVLVGFHIFGNAVEGVDYGGVISASEGVAYFDQLQCQELSAEVHGDLPGYGELFGACFGAQAVRCDAPLPGHDLLDGGNGDGGGRDVRELGAAAVAEFVSEGFAGEVYGDFAVFE